MGATKIAFVSCAYATYRRDQPAWAQILEAQPDLLLMLGDNAYMSWDGTDWLFDKLEDCYVDQFKVPTFRRLIDSVPTLAVWDDHDCGPNDTYGAEAPPDYLATTREKFDRWMGFARNNNRPHMYCSYRDIPNVQVLMLDGRTYRTRPDKWKPVLFGQAQEQWLAEQLDPTLYRQPAITIVATGSAFSEGDSVSKYPAEAKRLRELLAFREGDAADSGRRALFLGGDIHRNHFFTHPEGFHELISSGVACFKPRTYVESEFVESRYSDNWGLITLDESQVRVEFFANAHTQGNPKAQVIDIATWKATPA
ncbi:alkaline phosphatase D family protein [Ideonella sp. 4Y16]|uniref:alkaline phosphatase D family protein n=1 Tax=Ideonella alba TaxID=2824118 RepID=UPI001B363437|nr:alkaline phosphatase D family protein [Ideonella alba]MBQ0942283.1 alkaline phosphatase D family protein [Ideonella alba]